MSHETLILAAELFALVVLVALGIWRITTRESRNKATSESGYDMRRDGPRQTA